LEEGSATLRLKMDMQSENPVMRDLIAYRIKYSPHPHVGDRWCIYPSYDYTHCIIDSLENITHSLCTLEFMRRRESYFWLLDALEIYKPVVWEYSRLNITHTILSKRKLIHLVKEGIVKGWDDPRMPTIKGFRRRGYTPHAINDFCERIGITRNENLQNYALLEHCVRDDLENIVNRALAVLDPLKIVLVNHPVDEVRWIDIPNHPTIPSFGTHKVPFSGVIYIEQSDFRIEDMKGYKRLAPGKSVGLLHTGCTITCSDVMKDPLGNPIELRATIQWPSDSYKAPKGIGYIQWVAEPEPGKPPLEHEVRLYDPLFKSKNPAELENWLDDINPTSMVIKNCFVEPFLKDVKAGDRVQFERIGFFCVDSDSTANRTVWNRIVSLKESNWEKK